MIILILNYFYGTYDLYTKWKAEERRGKESREYVRSKEKRGGEVDE